MDYRFKIPPSERARVVSLKQKGLTIAAIARQYGVTRQTIYKILNPDFPKSKPTKPTKEQHAAYMRRYRQRHR